MSALLEVNNLTKYIGELELFSNISFSIESGEKAALIAKNGEGKTTLLNIISGEETFDSGEVTLNNKVKTAYLPQEPFLDEHKTIIEAVFQTENQTLAIISEYEMALTENNNDKIEKLTLKIDNLKAWDYENKIRQLLTQLGIHNLKQKISELSGGQKKRVAIASVLIDEPDFIILDEPTNHLDIEAISWLEGYLRRSNIALLIVTHDRYFLDRICTNILELDDKQLFKYRGNFSYFLKKRRERIENKKAEIEKAENTLRKEDDWIHRMPKARGTKAKYRIERYYETKNIANQTIQDNQIKINVSGQRLGKKILIAENINFSWNNQLFIKNFTHTFSRYEKVGIIGKNGCGKSTLLDIITRKIKPESGVLETGETIKFGYYTQKGIAFDSEMRVLDAITEIAETITLSDGKIITASQFLNHFLFHPSRQYDYISKLSGGEKKRLYLCKVLMQNPNFLILDEPTNDLDIPTLEVLEDYLKAFNGCVIIVSHDRYLIDETVDHLFVFEENSIKDFPGNYTQYYEWKQNTVPESNHSKAGKSDTRKAKPKNQNKLTYAEKIEFERLENEIHLLEDNKKQLEEELNSGTLDTQKAIEISNKIGEVMQQINNKSERWFELAGKENNA